MSGGPQVNGGSRIGLFGGTFDPIHRGHVDLALACQAELGLDGVWLMPASLPPHKPAAMASAHHRLAMVALAAAAHDSLVPEPCELERAGASYTVDTLERIHATRPDVEVHLLVGADSLRDFSSWRRWRDIVSLAKLVATARVGVDLDAALASASSAIPSDRLLIVRHEPPGWSSRELRARLCWGDPCRDALDGAVAAYIEKCGLYAPGSGPASEPCPGSLETTT